MSPNDEIIEPNNGTRFQEPQQLPRQPPQPPPRRRNSPVLIIDHNEHSANGVQRLPIITQHNFDSNQQMALLSESSAHGGEGGAGGGPLMEVEFYGEKIEEKCENLPAIAQNGRFF